ncbi:DUF2069 domain-containing protein [Methylomarinum sp. Ch1-1]|uniref:DUF2069 domain-containing protein n=1 Tax=Methylomarinum roseum TaxID=3067653 RepID=A0AAU7NV74_9GAMM|nr:DUF2069 domain-containing protein [Methylomarinum sp. Ch1-1]MDP4519079.1 DUF2069 domain-containing protein [Methylomarinum sp. Ch1-1]
MKRIYYYYAAVTGFFGLFILLMAWNTVLAPSTRFPVALVLLVAVTPLLLPMQGLLHGKLKSCTWMSYVSLLYFTHGVAEAYANPAERYYALAEIALSLLLCFGAGLYVYKADKH